MKYTFTFNQITDCYNCPCLNEEMNYCQIDNKDIEGYGKRPDDCPLIESEEQQ